MGASRLKGKPLIPIKGIPMIIHILKSAIKSGVGKVYVTSPDKEILEVVSKHGGNGIMTGNHPNGTSRVYEAFNANLLPKSQFDLINNRFSLVLEGIARIEKASGIRFPIAYVEPSVVLSSTSNSFDFGILFARTIPVFSNNSVQIIIQISGPLIAYGLKGTIHAILAHEFLHYLELISRLSKMNIVSDELSSNLFENVYTDNTRLFEPQSVFDDKTLLQHITKKFPSGFRDYKLEDKVMKFWIEKNLPTLKITLDTNIVKLNAETLSQLEINPILLKRLEQIQLKNSKIRKKKIY